MGVPYSKQFFKTSENNFPKEHTYFDFNSIDNSRMYVADVNIKFWYYIYNIYKYFTNTSKTLECKKSYLHKNKIIHKLSKILNYEYDFNVIDYIYNQNTENNGIFAKKFISKNTIICRADTIINKRSIIELINDLNFYTYMDEYEYHIQDSIIYNTNVRILCINGINYVQAIKDIECGQELSRLYGIKYWFENKSKYDTYTFLQSILTSYRITKIFNDKTFKLYEYDDIIKHFDMSNCTCNEDICKYFTITGFSPSSNYYVDKQHCSINSDLNDGTYAYAYENDSTYLVIINDNKIKEFMRVYRNGSNYCVNIRYYYENNKWYLDVYNDIFCNGKLHLPLEEYCRICDETKTSLMLV